MIAAACPIRFIDLLLLCRLGFFDDFLLLALGRVDGRIPEAFRVQNRGPLFALCPHLLLHGREHVVGRIDVLDLVTEHFDAPRFRRFVKLVYDLSVDVGSLLERFIEFDLSDLATQRRLASWVIANM